MTRPVNLRDRALAFRALHVPGRPLVLPNAWDIASAVWSRTRAPPRWPPPAPGARIVAAVDVPVTADIESGYADDPAGVASTVRAVLDAGAVGVNIEDALYDGEDGPLRPVAEQAERIAAAREAADTAGVPLFVNVRIDTFLRGAGGVDLTLERAAAFRAAGADGVFVPGAVDPGIVKVLADSVDGPLNIMAGPGAPPVAELAALGVARVSVGSAIAQAAHAVVRRAAREVLGAGTYESLVGGLDYGVLNSLLGQAR